MAPAADLIECLNAVAARRPKHLFLRTAGGRELTYGALADQVARFGAALTHLDVAPQDRVAVQVEKSVEAVLLYLACLQVGAVFVPINSANTPTEVAYLLDDARPRLTVVDPRLRDVLEPAARAAGVAHLETLSEAGDGSFTDLVRRMARYADPRVPAEGELGAIVYTSGTTGRPKGAMLTRANLAANAHVLSQAWQFSGTDVLMHVLPLFHIHGLFVALNTLLVQGAGLLFFARYDPAVAVRHLRECSVFMGVPTHYTRLLQQPSLDADACAGMRLFVSGSAPLLAETHRVFRQRTAHTILERYGMTETLIITANPYAGPRRAGSVGTPLPGTALRIAVADEQGVGGIEVQSPAVFAGYWQDEAKTRAEFTDDGWFRTGDLGVQDGEGYVSIVGRAKDLVISGGFNVYPKEVESEIDLLAGVLESAVFGLPHPDFGEGVTAAVVARPGAALTEALILEAIQGRLARYKIPKRVLLLEELPRNTMGKVQKNELRRRFDALYRA